MKKPATFRISAQTIERLQRLSKLTGDSQATILEEAIEEYEESVDDNRKRFRNLYNLVSENIQMLEMKRDINPETQQYWKQNENHLDDDEKQVLNFYNTIWDEIRAQPFFSEVLPPELEDF